MTGEDGRRRVVTGYNPDFDLQYAPGHQGELFVADTWTSFLDGARIEVKTDLKTARTGNVFLEYDCWKSGLWTPSGICRNTGETAELMAVVPYRTVAIIAPQRWVRSVAFAYRESNPGSDRPGATEDRNPTHGIVIPIATFVASLHETARQRDGGSDGYR